MEIRLCCRRHWHFLNRSRHVLVHLRQDFRRTRKLYHFVQTLSFKIWVTRTNNWELQKFEFIIGHAPGDEEAPSSNAVIEEKVITGQGKKGSIP